MSNALVTHTRCYTTTSYAQEFDGNDGGVAAFLPRLLSSSLYPRRIIRCPVVSVIPHYLSRFFSKILIELLRLLQSEKNGGEINLTVDKRLSGIF